jgi:hypothetical protein
MSPHAASLKKYFQYNLMKCENWVNTQYFDFRHITAKKWENVSTYLLSLQVQKQYYPRLLNNSIFDAEIGVDIPVKNILLKRLYFIFWAYF